MVVFSATVKPMDSVDSLKTELRKSAEDTTRILIYIELFNSFLNLDNDSALKYTNLGLHLAKKLENPYWIGKMLSLKGSYLIVKNDLSNARDYYLKSVEQFEDSKHSLEIADSYLSLGNIFVAQGNFSGALQYYLNSLSIADSLNQIELMSHLFNNLGIIYFKLEDFDKSLKYYEKAVDLHSEIGNPKGKAIALTNISNIHIGQKNYEDAKYHINSAKEIAISISDDEILAECYVRMGSVEYRQENYEKALSYYIQGRELLEDLGQTYMGPSAIKFANNNIYTGSCYFELGEYELAKDYFLRGYEIAEQTGQLELLKELSRRLYTLFKEINNYVDALEYFELFKVYSDSIESTENIRKVAQLEMQFEFDKKTKERELEQTKKDAVQKRNELIYLMTISGILFGLIIFILLFLLQKNKVKRIELNEKNLELELDSKNKEVTTNVLYLLKKNEFILNMVEKLKKAKIAFKPETNIFLDKFIKELESGTSKDTWQEFETRFQDVHTGFYKELNTQFPDLTPNELKLCAFLRLNMSSKEISTITFQSFSTLTTARYRLRKKLGIERDENLISFLNQL